MPKEISIWLSAVCLIFVSAFARADHRDRPLSVFYELEPVSAGCDTDPCETITLTFEVKGTEENWLEQCPRSDGKCVFDREETQSLVDTVSVRFHASGLVQFSGFGKSREFQCSEGVEDLNDTNITETLAHIVLQVGGKPKFNLMNDIGIMNVLNQNADLTESGCF